MKRGIFTSVVLSAFAVGFVSNAHAAYSRPSWFDAGIDSYVSWPSGGSDTNIVGQGTWSGTANATLDTGSSPTALVVNADGDNKLTFEVDTKVNAETTNATYNATMIFPNVSTAVSELSDPGAGVKAGLAVAKSGDDMVYCGRAKDPDGATNIWVVLEGETAPVADEETSVTVDLKTEGGFLKVQYSVDNEVLTYNDEEWLVLASNDFTLNGAKFAGSGYRLSALSGEVSEKEPEEPDEPEEAPGRALEEILSSAPALNTAAARAALEAERRAATGDSYIAEGYDCLESGLYLKAVSGLTWRGYVMLVTDPTRIRLRDTSMQYECGENVMTMVTNNGAVAGINGGGFVDGPNYDSNGGTPGGLLIEEGALVCPLTADDTVYNMIGINTSGALVLRHCTADWALSNGIVSAVSFAPFLVVNGEGMIKNGTGGWGIAPRTAIGQRQTGEMLLLVIDGRQADWSVGCDLDVLQDVMLSEGAVNAAMLDGGSSTAMVYAGEYVNRPSLGHERWINNCFVVMPAG